MCSDIDGLSQRCSITAGDLRDALESHTQILSMTDQIKQREHLAAVEIASVRFCSAVHKLHAAIDAAENTN
jgi:hypothetical protein